MYFIGDTHGLKPVFEIIDWNKLENSNIIHVGDFGLGFNEITRDVKNLLLLDEALCDTGNELYVIRGNHDNPIFWDKSKGLNLPKFHNLHLVDDYTVISIEDKNVFFAGGAISIDRSVRKDEKPYASWWKDEEFRYNRIKFSEAMRNFPTIDIVVTHTAPNMVYPTNDNVDIVNTYHALEKMHGKNLKAELGLERSEMTEMYINLVGQYGKKPKHWFYGHFHSSKKTNYDGIEFKLLNINELYELK